MTPTKPPTKQPLFLPTPLPPPRHTHTAPHSRTQAPICSLSRRNFLALPLLSLLPQLTRAAVPLPEAHVELQSAYDSLPTLSKLLSASEFSDARNQLRSGPMSRIRASGTALYRQFPEGTDRYKTAESGYRGLIRALEDLDVAALRAERGGKEVVVLGDKGVVTKLMGVFDNFLSLVN